MNQGELYMQQALNLAWQGVGCVNPNPMVGAVLVKDGKVIGEGYHQRYGQLHAERNAVANCEAQGHSAQGATLYVTLEPCCHTGKTPPCTDLILEKKVAKVVVGCVDPHAKVGGQGISILRNAGVEVEVGVLESQCRGINQVFFHYIQHKTPYVVLKYAMTMDGKIATVTGESQWITGEEARQKVHQDRNQYTGIMVGVGTLLADNPMLNCRLNQGRNPIRIVCDSHLKTPFQCNLVQTAKEIPTILATCVEDPEKHRPYLDLGCEILVTSPQQGRVNLVELMEQLGARNLDSILLEGGSELHFSALKAGIIQKVHCYIAPKIFGGQQAKTPVGGEGIANIKQAIPLIHTQIRAIGTDFLLEGEVDPQCLQEL